MDCSENAIRLLNLHTESFRLQARYSRFFVSGIYQNFTQDFVQSFFWELPAIFQEFFLYFFHDFSNDFLEEFCSGYFIKKFLGRYLQKLFKRILQGLIHEFHREFLQKFFKEGNDFFSEITLEDFPRISSNIYLRNFFKVSSKGPRVSLEVASVCQGFLQEWILMIPFKMSFRNFFKIQTKIICKDTPRSYIKEPYSVSCRDFSSEELQMMNLYRRELL